MKRTELELDAARDREIEEALLQLKPKSQERHVKIEFNTREYEFSHGKAPRGRGSWAFFFSRSMNVADAFWTPGNTTYGEAKKLARAEALRRGATPVIVGS
jgi:hypothetical protein